MDGNWQKQGNEPLFPDVIWSKPEQKRAAGRLLILGGHRHGFDALGRAYQAAVESGVGEAKVALPDKLKPALKPIMPEAVYAESTDTGSLSQDGRDAVARYVDWAQATLLIQSGENSETSLLFGELLRGFPEHKFILSDEIVTLLAADIAEIAKQPDRLWVLSFEALQKLAQALSSPMALRSDMGLRPFVLAAIDIQQLLKQPVVSIYEDAVVVVSNGRAASTKRSAKPDAAMLAGTMAVWWLQQPDKPLEALTSAAFEF